MAHGDPFMFISADDIRRFLADDALAKGGVADSDDYRRLQDLVLSIQVRVSELEHAIQSIPDEVIRRLADGIKTAPPSRSRVME